MKYVIRNSNGKYVSLPGRARSFCRKLKHCQVFDSEEAALAACCENESPVRVDSVTDDYFNDRPYS